MGREHAVVQQQLDARLRRQRREATEEVERIEQQRARAIAPRAAQSKAHATLRGDREGVLSDRRSQDVSAEVLEAFSVAGRYGNPRVQIEAGDVRVARRTRAVLQHLRRATEAHRSAAGVGADGGAPRHRRRGETREQRRLLGELVTASAVDDPIPFDVDALPLRDAHDAPPHRRENAPDIVIRRRRQRHEARAVAGEHALHDERVEVDVQVRRRAEALDRGDGPAAAVGDTAPPRPTSLEGQHCTKERSEHAPAEPLVVGKRVTQPVRRREHPLPDRQAAEHVVDEVCGEGRDLARAVRATLGSKPVIAVEQEVVAGDPYREIVDAASEADCIVKCTLGRTGLAHLVIGSVAEKVVRHAPVPVLPFRPDAIRGSSMFGRSGARSARPARAA